MFCITEAESVFKAKYQLNL